MLPDHDHEGAPLDAHGRAQVLPRGRVHVRDLLLLTDGGEVAHHLRNDLDVVQLTSWNKIKNPHLDGCDVPGEDDDARLPLPDPGLDVLEAVAHHRLVLRALLDALVDLKPKLDLLFHYERLSTFSLLSHLKSSPL